MRRYLFYILIAVLTFVISYFLVFQYVFLINNTNTKTTEISKTEIPLTTSYNLIKKESLPEEPKKKITYSCENKIINALEPFLKTKDFVSRVKNKRDLFKFNFPSNNIDCDKIYKIEEIDINKDGRKEIFILGNTSGFCNARGNCLFWVFAKHGKTYKKILHHEWTLSYKVSQKYTRNYANIEVTANSTVNPSYYLHKHNFNGKSYKLKKCISVYNSFYKGEKLKKPKKLIEPCDQ